MSTTESEVLPAVKTAPTTELELIAEVLRNPEKFDVQKFDAVMRWRERERELQLLDAFNTALNQAQSKMTVIAADLLNPQTHSRYASYAALDRAIRQHYVDAGLSISFDEGVTDKENHVRTLAYVSCGAYTRTYHKDMPVVTQGIRGVAMMTLTHATASAHAYNKRYLLADIFNLAIDRDRDDDGNAAGADDEPRLTEEQIIRIEKLLKTTKSNTALFLKWAKVKAIGDIRQSYYDSCVKTLEMKLPGAKK